MSKTERSRNLEIDAFVDNRPKVNVDEKAKIKKEKKIKAKEASEGVAPMELKQQTKPAKTKKRKMKRKKAAKSIDPHVPYRVYCRAPNPINGAWEDCFTSEQTTFRELNSTVGEAPAITNHVTGMMQDVRPKRKMLAQECLDAAGHGRWESTSQLDENSLGSTNRYAGVNFYMGPPTKVNMEDPGIGRFPHAREHTRGGCADCPHFDWAPDSLPQGCPEYTWMYKNEVQSCLAGTWLALWGDSTMRITFSALVDFLGDGIQDDRFPTHDFTYHGHNARFDHCREGRCFVAVHFPKHDILLTFDFVSRIKDWPDLWETMVYYADTETFPELKMTKKRPDLVLLNSGPWEHYWRGQKYKHPWDGDFKYMERFGQFLKNHFVAQNETDTTSDLLILRNTACPQQRKCEGSNYSCAYAMENIHDLQSRVVHEFMGKHPEANVRYLDGSFAHTVPDGYTCADETGFHLPGVITDVRLNHALHAVCQAH